MEAISPKIIPIGTIQRVNAENFQRSKCYNSTLLRPKKVAPLFLSPTPPAWYSQKPADINNPSSSRPQSSILTYWLFFKCRCNNNQTRVLLIEILECGSSLRDTLSGTQKGKKVPLNKQICLTFGMHSARSRHATRCPICGFAWTPDVAGSKESCAPLHLQRPKS